MDGDTPRTVLGPDFFLLRTVGRHVSTPAFHRSADRSCSILDVGNVGHSMLLNRSKLCDDKEFIDSGGFGKPPAKAA